MHGLNRKLFILEIVLVGSLALSGCATKKWVRHEIGNVDTRISEVSMSLTETKERVDVVDRRAQEGLANAAIADQKATAAAQAAGVADSKAAAAARQAESANQGVKQAANRIDNVESRLSSMDTYTSGEPVTVMFGVNSAALTDEGKQQLDTVASGVAGQKTGYLIEIQGFTDASGAETYNIGLSQRRAESVLRYLVSKGIPLYRTSVVGLGEEKPVAGNSSRQERAQNRRVEVRVMQSAAFAGATPTN